MNSFILYDDRQYKKAFKELLEILKYIPKSDLEKIPQDVIHTLENNADSTYDFNIDLERNIKEQKISELTKAIIENFYRDYWVTDIERKKILQEENLRRKEIEEQKRLAFNPDDIFKNREKKSETYKI